MSKIILVTGGVRSGKSNFAESLFLKERDVVYIATALALDKEMEDRINKHRARRSSYWRTFETVYNISEAISNSKFYILDCITVFVSNLMYEKTNCFNNLTNDIIEEVQNEAINELNSLIKKVRTIEASLVMVTNEVGYSVVPENEVARLYRDIAGRVNQFAAACSDEVYMTICGLPVRIK